MQLPYKGIPTETILQRLKNFKKNDVDFRNGRLFSYVYYPGQEGEALLKAAYSEYITENGIDPTTFPSIAAIENEVIGVCRDLLRGDDQVCGHITTGGTESLLLALKTARDRAKALQPHILKPEVILPYTVHASFFKACSYFNIIPRVIPVDKDFKADLSELKKAINENTILIAGSAPAYAYGVTDPIKEMGKIALENNLLFHVDGCIGGFFMSYMRRAGMNSPDFDFSVPGVTSISMDLHKYAYAGKGCSVLMFKTEELRKYQYWVCPEWSGYTIINPTILSSKTGGPVAGAWAMMHYFGEEGYQNLAKDTMVCTENLKQQITDIPELELIGKPDMSLISFTSKGINIYQLNDELNAMGWKVQFQSASNVAPPNIHLTVSKPHIGREDEFIHDLKIAVENVKLLPQPDVKAILSQAFAEGPSAEKLIALLGSLGAEPGKLPDNLSVINEMLDLLPNEVVKELLFTFVSGIYKAKS